MFFQLAINGIIAAATYSLISVGFNMIYWVTKFFNISYGAMAVIGAYTVLYLYKTAGLNLFFSVLVGIILAGIAGFLSDKIIFSFLRKKKFSEMSMFVASLGLMTVIQSLIAMIFTSQFNILTHTFQAQKTFLLMGAAITEIHLVIIISVIIILIGFYLIRHRTSFGKAAKAIGDDIEVAKIVGINTDRVIGYVFFIGSATAGLGGILVGFDIGIVPTMGMSLILKGVTASIIGGLGNIYGGVMGAFLLGTVENFSVWKISGEWKDAIAFALLILFLLYKPQGIIKKV